MSEVTLRGIGAVTIVWNEVEFLLETLLYSGLGVSDGVWPDVARQFRAAEPKIDLIQRISHGFHLDGASQEVVTTTLEDVMLLKQYRDLIVRARPFEPPSGVSQAIRRGGEKEDQLLAPEALHRLYQRLSIIRRELKLLLTLFGTIRSYAPVLHDDPVRSENSLPVRQSFVRELANRYPQLVAPSDMIDRDELLIEFRQKLAELIEDIQNCQRDRSRLPPLPPVLAS